MLLVPRDERAGRAASGHDAAEGAEVLAHLQHLPQGRAQRDRRRLQVVVQGLAQEHRVAGADGLHEHVGHVGVGNAAPGPEPVALGVDRRGRQAAVGQGEHPVEGATGQHRRQLLPPAGADGRAAVQGERHVRAQLGRQCHELLAGGALPPEGVAGEQGRGGVGTAAGHPSGDRDRLVHMQVHRRLDARVVGQEQGRPIRQVAVVEGELALALPRHGQGHARAGGRPRDDLVEQAHGLEHGGELVVAVASDRADRQLQVHLGGHPDGNR